MTGIKPLLMALICLSSFTWAEVEQEFVYRPGATSEYIELDRMLEVTRYRKRQIAKTCYRDEAYQVRVCRNQTFYRRECRNVPGRRVCRTVNKRRCTVVSGKRRCRVIPVKQCRTQPPRRVCRDVPYTKRVCHYETRYRQVPYTCYQTITEPYQVSLPHYVQLDIAYLNDSAERHRFLARIDELADVNIEQINSTSTRARIVNKDIDRVDEENRVILRAKIDLRFIRD